MEAFTSKPHITLFDLLSNDLVLRQISPILGAKNLSKLAATSRPFRELVLADSQCFYRTDLSDLRIGHPDIPGYQWNDQYPMHVLVQCVAAYSYLDSHKIAHKIRTLILDDQFVPFHFLSRLLMCQSSQIQLLSLLRSRGYSEENLGQLIRYLIRPSRPHPEESPKLKGLYCFAKPTSTTWFEYRGPVRTTIDNAQGVTNAAGAQLGAAAVQRSLSASVIEGNDEQYDAWYSRRGLLLNLPLHDETGDLIQACEGVISFDAVICRHDRELYQEPRPEIANVRLDGCKNCGSCPEGPAYPGQAPRHYVPLVSPPPLYSSNLNAAQKVHLTASQSAQPAFIARCRLCLRDRWCQNCNAWWCENCYTPPSKGRQEGLSKAQETSNSPVTSSNIKVHDGLCVANCLVTELLCGRGEGGMWG